MIANAPKSLGSLLSPLKISSINVSLATLLTSFLSSGRMARVVLWFILDVVFRNNSQYREVYGQPELEAI